MTKSNYRLTAWIPYIDTVYEPTCSPYNFASTRAPVRGRSLFCALRQGPLATLAVGQADVVRGTAGGIENVRALRDRGTGHRRKGGKGVEEGECLS